MGYNRNRNNNPEGEEHTRIVLPDSRKKEVLGYVERKLGAYRMYIKCSDGKIRICRIPGAMRRRIWIKENDLVIVKPWEFEEDIKGDVVYLYTKSQETHLRNKGFLKAFDTIISDEL